MRGDGQRASNSGMRFSSMSWEMSGYRSLQDRMSSASTNAFSESRHSRHETKELFAHKSSVRVTTVPREGESGRTRTDLGNS